MRAGFEQAGILEPRPKRNDAWTPEPLVRPPVLCAGCPHTSSFMAVRASGARVAGDIGCYTLACLDPLRGMDTTVSMGSSIGNAIGMAKAGETKPVVATIGDSTFLHAGIPQLINAVYNQANITVLLLDNHMTAMTGRPATSRHRQDAARRGRAARSTTKRWCARSASNGCAPSIPTILPPCISRCATPSIIAALPC